MSPKLSVIVPIWGVEKYIEKCARSLFESDLEDMEFIFVNDCTPDRSIEILTALMEEYPERKKQSRIVHHKENKGLPQARKTGYEASHGEWITYVDSDDWIASTMYSKMLATAALGGYDLVHCDFVYRSDTEVLVTTSYDKSKSPNQFRNDLLSCKVSNAVWNKIVHRSIYARNEIYFPFLSMDEDDVLTCQWAFYADNPGYVHECLYFHYANPDSMTHEKNDEKKRKGIIDRINNRKWIVNFLEQKKDASLAEAINLYKISVKQFSSELTRKQSRNIFPEVNNYMLFSNQLSIFDHAINFLFLYMYPAYPFVKKMKIVVWLLKRRGGLAILIRRLKEVIMSFLPE